MMRWRSAPWPAGPRSGSAASRCCALVAHASRSTSSTSPLDGGRRRRRWCSRRSSPGPAPMLADALEPHGAGAHRRHRQHQGPRFQRERHARHARRDGRAGGRTTTASATACASNARASTSASSCSTRSSRPRRSRWCSPTTATPCSTATPTARQLFGEGRKLEGERFSRYLDAAPAPLREAIERGGDTLFTLELGRRTAGLSRVAAALPAERPAAPAAAAQAAHARDQFAGSGDLEEGDPRDRA